VQRRECELPLGQAFEGLGVADLLAWVAVLALADGETQPAPVAMGVGFTSAVSTRTPSAASW
jgi:hypothetical protein